MNPKPKTMSVEELKEARKALAVLTRMGYQIPALYEIQDEIRREIEEKDEKA